MQYGGVTEPSGAPADDARDPVGDAAVSTRPAEGNVAGSNDGRPTGDHPDTDGGGSGSEPSVEPRSEAPGPPAPRWAGAVASLRRAAESVPAWIPRWTGRIAVVLIGATIGLLLGARTTHEVGPFQANLELTVGLHGGTTVRIPPLGALDFDSHDGPLQLRVDLIRLDQAQAEALFRDPQRIRFLGDAAATDVRHAVTVLALKGGLSGLAGALILSVLVYRRRREALVAGGLAVALLVGTAGGAAATWRPASLREPSYTGLLASAPTVVGSAQELVTRFNAYRDELGGLVTNLSRLYATASSLPAYQLGDSTIRVLHVSDLDLSPSAFTIIRSLVQQYQVGAVVDTGNITDYGSEPEERYVAGIRTLRVPYVYVRGSDDSARTAQAVAAQPNAVVLDGGRPREVARLSFLGIGDPGSTPGRSSGGTKARADRVRATGQELDRIVRELASPPDVTLVSLTRRWCWSAGRPAARACAGCRAANRRRSSARCSTSTRPPSGCRRTTRSPSAGSARRRRRSSGTWCPTAPSPTRTGNLAGGTPPSSSGPGRRPFKAVARVRIPLGAPIPQDSNLGRVVEGLRPAVEARAASHQRRVGRPVGVWASCAAPRNHRTAPGPGVVRPLPGNDDDGCAGRSGLGGGQASIRVSAADFAAGRPDNYQRDAGGPRFAVAGVRTATGLPARTVSRLCAEHGVPRGVLPGQRVRLGRRAAAVRGDMCGESDHHCGGGGRAPSRRYRHVPARA